MSSPQLRFQVTFWGVRGSIAVPGPDTVGIGGNTSCVEVRCGHSILIFDGGTGLRLLGNQLLKEMPITAHLFFSHLHWDHIQGFPFFAPAFIKGNTIHMYGRKTTYGTVESALAGQMEHPNFPVMLNQLGSTLNFHDLHQGDSVEPDPGLTIVAEEGNHPGGVFAYRVDYQGKSIVYATDTEHRDENKPEPALVKLCENADIFIYDSMYTPEEYTGQQGGLNKVGWGHSTFVAGAGIAKAANVKQYVLFHHDPDQNDEAVRQKEKRSQALFPNSMCAYEGLTLKLL